MSDTQMDLVQFRVANFRSIEDSGWIRTDDITALIGTNESGKTNLLLALWKLKPAKEKEGEILTIADYPRKYYADFRDRQEKPIFITAHFRLSDALTKQIVTLTNVSQDFVRIASVSRDFSGKYRVGFPEVQMQRHAQVGEILHILAKGLHDIEDMSPNKTDEPLKQQMLGSLLKGQELAEAAGSELGDTVLREIASCLDEVNLEKASKNSLVRARYGEVSDLIGEQIARVTTPEPYQNAEARQLVLSNVPAFVYYSTYGNLDSEIYLPHVIQNMNRSDLGVREEAKARTLRVLFEFVRLKPQEIQALGHDLPEGTAHTDEQIKATADKKREREILLQSASTSLTEKFRAWWKQGDYRFRMQADGDHFRIWVSDDKRPEEIELEGRSAGLQWFLSFYLVFLVEQQDAHKGAIVLLDEPGHSLHPLAQQDLSAFFEDLGRTNQLLYTTHSPFLVDPNHLDRVKVVYVDDKGNTVASANLRASESRPAESRSVYPVHAALGLTVSETLLQGCQPVIVEGPADQIYLSAVKVYLISKRLIAPSREILFMPAGGVKGINSLVAIVAAKEDEYPYVLLDSDKPGNDIAKHLRTGNYQRLSGRVLQVGDIVGIADTEVEDLFPAVFLGRIISKYLRAPGADQDFDETLNVGEPIVPQVEAYAQQYGISLEAGWKVEIAKLAKERMLRSSDDSSVGAPDIERWVALFNTFGTLTT